MIREQSINEFPSQTHTHTHISSTKNAKDLSRKPYTGIFCAMQIRCICLHECQKTATLVLTCTNRKKNKQLICIYFGMRWSNSLYVFICTYLWRGILHRTAETQRFTFRGPQSSKLSCDAVVGWARDTASECITALRLVNISLSILGLFRIHFQVLCL